METCTPLSDDPRLKPILTRNKDLILLDSLLGTTVPTTTATTTTTAGTTATTTATTSSIPPFHATVYERHSWRRSDKVVKEAVQCSRFCAIGWRLGLFLNQAAATLPEMVVAPPKRSTVAETKTRKRSVPRCARNKNRKTIKTHKQQHLSFV